MINLDKVRALLELLPNHGNQLAGVVGVSGVGRDVLGGIEVDGVFMAAENAYGVAAHRHARAGNQSRVDGIAHGGIGRARALGAHVALGREARHQIVAGRDFGKDGALGHGFDNRLQIFGSRMQKKMDVGVDQPRHQGCRAQIDHRRSAGMGDRGASLNNAIAAHQHLSRANKRAMLHIEDVGGMEHDNIARGSRGGRGGSLRLERRRSGEGQNKREPSGSGAQGQ